MKNYLLSFLLTGMTAAVFAQSPSSTQTNQQLESNRAAINSIDNLPGSNQSLGAQSQALNNFLSGAKPAQANAPQAKYHSDLLIFISLSMPEEAIKGYAKQAKDYGATLMIRGFVDDKLSATRVAASRLDAIGAAWQVNPQAFTKFKVNKVPAIVLATSESSSLTEEGCAPTGTYSQLYGDVQVGFALNKFYEKSQAKISALAKERMMIFSQEQAQGKLN